MEPPDHPVRSTVHEALIAAIEAQEIVTLQFLSGPTAVVEPHLYGRQEGIDTLVAYAYGESTGGTSAWRLLDVTRIADVTRWRGHQFPKRQIPAEYDAP